MNRLNRLIPLALLINAALCTNAQAEEVKAYDFALHGYIRSGILANSDGNRVDSVGLMPDGNGVWGTKKTPKSN
jgi:sucrose porin